MARAIKKAGIGAIIPRKLLEKKGKKNFDKGKEMLGPLMGMMKEGGKIPKIPELPRTYLAYKRQAKKNMGSKTGTDLYKNIMLIFSSIGIDNSCIFSHSNVESVNFVL